MEVRPDADDLPQLQHFGKHVEHELGLDVNGPGTIRLILHAAATAKVTFDEMG